MASFQSTFQPPPHSFSHSRPNPHPGKRPWCLRFRAVAPTASANPPRRAPPPPPRNIPQSKRINKLLLAAGSPDELLFILSEEHPAMNYINLATAIHRLAKFTRLAPVRSAASRAPPPRRSHPHPFPVLRGIQPIPDGTTVPSEIVFHPDFALLIRLIERHAPLYQPRAVANTLWAFAALGVAPSRQLLAQLESAALPHTEDLKPQEISSTLWAYATMLISPDRDFVRELKRMAALCAGAFGPQAVSNTLWAAARLAARPASRQLTEDDDECEWRYRVQRFPRGAGDAADSGLWEAMEFQVVRLARELGSQGVANIIWAFAAVERTLLPETWEALEKELIAQPGALNPQDVSNILWSVATLEMQISEDLRSILEDQATALFPSFNAQNIGNTLWAFACLGISPEGELWKVAERVILKRIEGFYPQAIANTLCSAAKLNHRFLDPRVFAVLEGRARITLQEFSPQNVSNMMWSYATVGVSPTPAFLALIEERISAVACDLKPQEVSNLCWAFARLRRSHVGDVVLDALALRAISVAPAAKAQEVATILWSFARLTGALERSLLLPLADRLVTPAVARAMNGQDIANVFWAHAKCGAAMMPELRETLEDGVVRLCGKFKMQEVANTLWAYMMMGEIPPEEMLTALEREIEERQQEMKPLDVMTIWKSYAAFGREPPVLWAAAESESAPQDANGTDVGFIVM